MEAVALQDAFVALVALAAAWIVVRRVIGFAAVETSPKCANCASSACAPASAPARRDELTPEVEHPLVFVRPTQH